MGDLISVSRVLRGERICFFSFLWHPLKQSDNINKNLPYGKVMPTHTASEEKNATRTRTLQIQHTKLIQTL